MNEDAMRKANYVKFVLRQMIATLDEATDETFDEAMTRVQRGLQPLADELYALAEESSGNEG